MKYVLMLSLLLLAATAQAANGIVYEGRLIKPNGLPEEGASVPFHIQIRSPGSENCLLFDEQQNIPMASSNGYFSITVGQGTRVSSGVDGGNSLEKIFANRGTLTGIPTCSIGNNYTPSSTDSRKIVVQFYTGATWETLPSLVMEVAPQAIEAQQVAGYGPNQLLRVADGVTASEMSNSQYTELMSLIAGTSTLYGASGSFSSSGGTMSGSLTMGGAYSIGLGKYSGTQETGFVAGLSPSDNGRMWYNSSSNKMTYYDGAPKTVASEAWVSSQIAAAAGVSGVSAGTGISMSGTAASPVVNLANTAVTAGSYGAANKSLSLNVDSQGRITNIAANNISIAPAQIQQGGATNGDLMKWTGSSWSPSPLNIDASQIQNNAGAYLKYKPNNSACGNGQTLQWNFSGQQWECNNSLFIPGSISGGVMLMAPAAGASGTYTWPATVPASNKLLQSDTSGNLSWIDVSSSLGFAPINKAGDTMTGSLTMGTSTQVKLADGIPASPAMSFASDTDTGLFHSGADAMALSVGGTTAMMVDTSGTKVMNLLESGYNSSATYTPSGGGAFPPLVKAIHANYQSADASGSQVVLTSRNLSNNSQSAYIGSFSTPGAGVYTPTLVFGHQLSSSGYTERMRIDSSGNVGIGTTAPSGKLTVSTTNSISPVVEMRAAAGQSANILEIKNSSSAVLSSVAANGDFSAPYVNTGGVAIATGAPQAAVDISVGGAALKVGANGNPIKQISTFTVATTCAGSLPNNSTAACTNYAMPSGTVLPGSSKHIATCMPSNGAAVITSAAVLSNGTMISFFVQNVSGTVLSGGITSFDCVVTSW